MARRAKANDSAKSSQAAYRRVGRNSIVSVLVVILVLLSAPGVLDVLFDGRSAGAASVPAFGADLPSFRLPYANTERVYWTGGPHSYNQGGLTSGTYPAGRGSGLDFANGTNFEVLAMAAGTVEAVKANDCNAQAGFGCYVAIRHDEGGSVLVYAHLAEGSILVSTRRPDGSQWHVDQGTVLGRAGNTGRQNGVHLHIDLRDGASSCFVQCLPNGLGGNPIGWDDLVPLVDGWRIASYLADTEGSNAYNYDGSAVRGTNVKVLYDGFHYFDDGAPRTPAVVRVHRDFSCRFPNDPSKSCENPANQINPNNLTRFAGQDSHFHGGGAPILIENAPDSRGPELSDVNFLASSNVRKYDPASPPSSGPSPTPTPVPGGNSQTYPIPTLNTPANGHTVQAGQSISFSWSNTGATHYRFEAWNDSGPGSRSETVSGTAFSFAPLDNGAWRWQVRSINGDGQPGPAPHTRSFTVGTPSGIMLFDGTNYTGESRLFTAGTYDDLGDWSDKAESVRLVGSYRDSADVTLYHDVGLQKDFLRLSRDTPDLGQFFNNKISSLKVEFFSGIQLCDGPNYSPPCKTFSEGTYMDLAAHDGWADRAESMRFQGDYAGRFHVHLSTERDLQGTPYHTDGNVASFGDPWRNHIRSMQITRSAPSTCSPGTDGVILFVDGQYNMVDGVRKVGAGCFTATQDVPDLRVINLDRVISTLQFVGSFVRTKKIVLYAEPDYRNPCGEYWQNQSTLLNCTDVAQSLRIVDFTPPGAIPVEPGDNFHGNLAPLAYRDRAGSEAMVDGRLDTEWRANHTEGTGFSWSEPVDVRRVVVWDREEGPDKFAIGRLAIAFSDGTAVQQIDMWPTSARCVDVTIPTKLVDWIVFYPTEGAAGHGYREIEIWASTGEQYSDNTCANKLNVTPGPGGITPPLATATPTGGQTPTPVTPTPTPVGEGPYGCDEHTVGLWRFTEGTGTTAGDACGGLHGTINNGSWVEGGAFGKPALRLNGTNSIVVVPDSPGFNTPQFTIEAVIYREAIGTGHANRQQLVRRESVDGRGNQFVLGFYENYLEVGAYCYGLEGRTFISEGRSGSAWTHVALTFDGATVRTYVNGKLDKALPYPGWSCPSTTAGMGPLIIGNNRANGDHFGGMVQYVRVSNVARTTFPNLEQQPLPPPTEWDPTGNVARQAYIEPSGAGAIVDTSLASYWLGGPGGHAPTNTVAMSWPEPVTVHRLIMWDLEPSPNGGNIYRVNLEFSDGTIANGVDLGLCRAVTFPAKEITWLKIVPFDTTGSNTNLGLREVEVWATTGEQSSANSCIDTVAVSPQPGSVTPPTATATPFPTGTPTPTATPLPTATPSPTPTPSPTVPALVVVNDVAAASVEGTTGIFAGTTAMFLITAQNPADGETQTTWSWEVFDDTSGKVGDLSLEDYEVAAPPGSLGLALYRTIPPDLPPGVYRFVGSVTTDGRKDTKTATFEVAADADDPSVALAAPAAGAALTNGAAIELTAGDGGGAGLAEVEVRYCPGTTCEFPDGLWIGSAFAAPYAVAWDQQPPDGAYTLVARATDRVGNRGFSEPVTVEVANDPTPPDVPGLTLSGDAPGQHLAGTTAYYNPNGGGGSFTVTASTADPDSGIAGVAFPAVFGEDGVLVESAPYAASYTWGATATASGSFDVVARNGVGRTATAAFAVIPDASGPAVAIEAAGLADPVRDGQAVAITADDGDGAGAAGVEVRYCPGEACAFADGAPIGTDDAAPYAVAWEDQPVFGAFTLVARATDRVGNAADSEPVTVRVTNDASAPAEPVLTVGDDDPAAHLRNGTLYYNAATAGAFAVTAATDDPESGIATVAFPDVFGDDGAADDDAPYGREYAWSAGASAAGAFDVVASNGAGGTATAPFHLQPDSTEPAVAIALAAAGDPLVEGAVIPITVDDGPGAGVARVAMRYCAGDTCAFADGEPIGSDDASPYAVTWSGQPVFGTFTLVARAWDAVGNVADADPVTVRVANDPTGPSAPVLTVAEESDAAHVLGDGTVVYNSFADAGSFTVEVASDDAESGIATVRFPEIFGNDATSDETAPFTAVYAWDERSETDGTFAVRVTNGVGIASETDLIIRRDADGPAVAITAPTSGASLVRGDAVALAADDGDGAGARRIEVRFCPGSECVFADGTPIGESTAEPYSVPWGEQPPDGTYTLIARGTDRVGNRTVSEPVTIEVANDPTAPDLALTLATNDDGVFIAGDVAYYDPAGAASLTVSAEARDDESGVARVRFPAVTGGEEIADGEQPYAATYAFDAGAGPAGPFEVIASNGVGRETAATFRLRPDPDAPSIAFEIAEGQRLQEGYELILAADDGNGAGIAVAEIRVCPGRTCAFAEGVSLGTLTAPPYRLAWNGQPSDGRYALVARVVDRVGHAAETDPLVVLVGNDASAPDAPALTLEAGSGSASQHVAGATLYYNPSSGNSGEFTVRADVTDIDSGIARVAFPDVFGGDGGHDAEPPYAQQFAWDDSATAAGSFSVRAENGAELTSEPATFELVPDTAPPAVVITVPLADENLTRGAEIAATADDGAGAGVARIEVVWCRGPSCDFAEGTPIAAVDGARLETVWEEQPRNGAVTLLARATDRVGNVAVSAPITVVLGNPDTTPPDSMTLAIAEIGESPDLRVDASDPDRPVVYYDPAPGSAGAFRVTVMAEDLDSGIAKVAFPALFGTGASTVASAPYERTYDWSVAQQTKAKACKKIDNKKKRKKCVRQQKQRPEQAAAALPDGVFTVTATNGAGMTREVTFRLVPDAAVASSSEMAVASEPIGRDAGAATAGRAPDAVAVHHDSTAPEPSAVAQPDGSEGSEADTQKERTSKIKDKDDRKDRKKDGHRRAGDGRKHSGSRHRHPGNGRQAQAVDMPIVWGAPLALPASPSAPADAGDPHVIETGSPSIAGLTLATRPGFGAKAAARW
jgi:murein DD-endopeptidase MepM/ murein hydrolase activator NlpD